MAPLGIGLGAERIGLAALRFPRIALIALGLFIALIAVSLPRLTFDNDIHRVFLSGSPLSQAQRAYDAAQSPPISTVLVHVGTTVPFTAEQLIALRDLSLDLELLGGATGVASPFILRFPPDADAPSGSPVFPARDTFAIRQGAGSVRSARHWSAPLFERHPHSHDPQRAFRHYANNDPAGD